MNIQYQIMPENIESQNFLQNQKLAGDGRQKLTKTVWGQRSYDSLCKSPLSLQRPFFCLIYKIIFALCKVMFLERIISFALKFMGKS